MLYSLQTYQTAMQTRLLKTTMSILNTLQLINTQTGKIVNGHESLGLYVYTISTSDDLVQLIQM